MNNRIEALKNIFNSNDGSTGFLVFADHSRSRFKWSDFEKSMNDHGLGEFIPSPPTLQSAFRSAIEDHDKHFGKNRKYRKFWSPVRNDKFGKELEFKLVEEVAGDAIRYEEVTIHFMDFPKLPFKVVGSNPDHESVIFTVNQYNKYEETGLSNKVYTAFSEWADFSGALSLPNGTKWLPSSKSDGIDKFQNAFKGFSRLSVWPLATDGRIKREVAAYALEDIGNKIAEILDKAEKFDQGTRYKTISDQLESVSQLRNEAFIIRSLMNVASSDLDVAISQAEQKLISAAAAIK